MLKKLEQTVVTNPTWLTHEIENVEYGVQQYFKGFGGSHDMNHVYRVVNMAMIIGKTEKKMTHDDAQLICLTALLHDVGDHKYCESEKARFSMLELLLQKFPNIKNRVIDAVNKVSWSYEKKNPNTGTLALELICVRDSDRLDAIGAIGIARCFAYGGEEKQSLPFSREHFTDKLFKIREHFITEHAKKIGEIKHKVMTDFCNSYDEEIEFVN